MMLSKQSFLFISLSLLMTTSYAAGANDNTNLLIAPTCLLTAAGVQSKAMAVKNNLQLVQVSDGELLKIAEAKHQTTGHCGAFINVTMDWNATKNTREFSATNFLQQQITPPTMHAEKVVYKIQYESQTNTILKNINSQNIWDNLTTLTNFSDRFCMSRNGLKAATWIKTKIEGIASETGHANDVTVYFVPTGLLKQPSVVAKFGNSDLPGVVIGAHMDTLWSMTSNKPGADDDGSGTVTLMETARTLLASGVKFKRPIYFIWYSAEEIGLVGSKYVVSDFQNKNIAVAAAMQMDMTGYEHNNDPTIWMFTDYTDNDLTNFTKQLITTYIKKPINTSVCGYGCSDHVSWNKAGIPVVMPHEAKMHEDDPQVHQATDTMDLLSLDHMTDFAKLGAAFAVELAEPSATH